MSNTNFIIPTSIYTIVASSLTYPYAVLFANSEADAVALFNQNCSDPIISVSVRDNDATVSEVVYVPDYVDPLNSTVEVVECLKTGLHSGSPGYSGKLFITSVSLPDNNAGKLLVTVQWAGYSSSNHTIIRCLSSVDGNSWTSGLVTDINISGSQGFYTFVFDTTTAPNQAFWAHNPYAYLQFVDTLTGNIFSQILPINI